MSAAAAPIWIAPGAQAYRDGIARTSLDPGEPTASPPARPPAPAPATPAADLLAHRDSLERIVRGEPLVATLERTCADIEARFPGSHCSVMLADVDRGVLITAAAPTLPARFLGAIVDLPIADGSAVCGTAVARGEAVAVRDMATDPLTERYAGLARDLGLHGVWSQPITRADGTVLGTFAVYRRTPHLPGADEEAVVGAAAALVSLALERHDAGLAAQVDAVTGLPNRARLLDLVDGHLPEPVTAMFLDLDGFKKVNDSLGHASGDVVLRTGAARLRDAVAGHAVVGRFGGDEFVVVVPPDPAGDPAGEEVLVAVATAVHEALAQPFGVGDARFHLSTAIGVSVARPSTTARRLLSDADAAMYVAKAGRIRPFVRYDDALRRAAQERVAVEADVRTAVVADQLQLRYQPLLDLRTGRWAGAEALLRWAHPARGLLHPAAFLGVVEEGGLMTAVGQRVLEVVARDLSLLRGAGHDLLLSLNATADQLGDPAFADGLAAVLERHDLSGGDVVVEITESAVMQRIDATAGTIERLRAQGVRLAIDDFGTGYSSLARLADLPVAAVKIDRTFTADLAAPRRRAVLAAVVQLAQAVGLSTVAEGIETAHALQVVRDLGVDVAQGYHVARPMPVSQLRALLAATPAVEADR